MPDTYRKKESADEYDVIDPSTGLCTGLNAVSFGCVASRSRIPPFGEDVEVGVGEEDEVGWLLRRRDSVGVHVDVHPAAAHSHG